MPLTAKWVAVLLTSAAAFTLTLPAHAQMSAADLKKQIQQRAGNIEEFRLLLNDPDQTVRLAALDVMLKSNDIAMRELAYGVCFNSADEAMRVVCLKNRFADLTTVGVQIGKIDSPSDTQSKALKEWGGIYNFEISEFDEKTGTFKTRGTHRAGTGQINGTGLVLSQAYCDGQLRLGEGGRMEGELGCRSNWTGTYPVFIQLQ